MPITEEQLKEWEVKEVSQPVFKGAQSRLQRLIQAYREQQKKIEEFESAEENHICCCCGECA